MSTTPTDPASASGVTFNAGYPMGQLLKAVHTSETDADQDVRELALAKVRRWRDVLEGMGSGGLVIGARRPIASVPVWATPEVVTGGFVTGNLLAGGELRDHERAWLHELGLDESAGRVALNQHFLSESGMLELSDRLDSGRFDIEVPEEGALLTVVWLLKHDQATEAKTVIDEIAPFFAQLRFYPLPTDHARSASTEVFVQDVRRTTVALENVTPHHQFQMQREMIRVWTPLMDRLVGLFLETVEGEPPDLARDARGAPLPVLPTGRFPTVGGWPCRHYPPGWRERAKSLLDDCTQARLIHRACGKPDRSDDNFCQLRTLLQSALPDPRQLTGRDVGRIRMILARHLAKHGQPGSDRRKALRAQQAREISAPMQCDLAKVIIGRLASFRPDDGLDDSRAVLRPIEPGELSTNEAICDIKVPRSLQRKVRCAQRDTIPNLVAEGILTSGESLALVLPRITAEIAASGISDESLRRVQAAVYRAFRKRRSLLLLNFASQVRIEELPWVRAIQHLNMGDEATRLVAMDTLKEVACATLSAFPQAIVPNRLVREFSSLAKQAGMELPLVEEIAADIFMGSFGAKFLQAAQCAASHLRGTLYQTYYQSEFDVVARMPLPTPPKQPRPWTGWFTRADSTSQADPFSMLCIQRAGAAVTGGWGVARNGTIIEQQQILTTQNLAALVGTLRLDIDAVALAQRCLTWIIRRTKTKNANQHAKLIMVKNVSYAWRQMIFFLSQAGDGAFAHFRTWMNDALAAEDEPLRSAFAPAIAGLCRAADGLAPEAPPDAKQLLGWTTGEHWLLQRL